MKLVLIEDIVVVLVNNDLKPQITKENTDQIPVLILWPLNENRHSVDS
jgi:hypothetical protein